MSETLYNDYKNNCYEYMKTVLYTEKIIKDNNSDQTKLLNIYEKAIKSAESMFKKMQLEVETNYMVEDKENELNNIYNEICECKIKLKKFKEEIIENDKRKYERTSNHYNNHTNYDDRILLLSDVDILEKGDVYINHSKILMDNTEYISNDVMNNLNKQRECIKKNVSNISFLSNKLDHAKFIIKNLNKKQLFNKYRLYIIFLFIILTFLLIISIKYNRYVKKYPYIKINNENNNKKNNIDPLVENQKLLQTQNEQNTNHTLNKFNNTQEAKSVFYDFEQKIDKDINNNNDQNKYINTNDYQNYIYNINMHEKSTDHNINTNNDEYNTFLDYNEIDHNHNKNELTQLDTYYKNEKQPEEKQKDNHHIIENVKENIDENIISSSNMSSNINEYPTKNNNNNSS
ncbi:putative vesicle transport v-SNARE protein VTI1 [Plasmodium gaboni]|uniref:Putative vesicle transport v-SNARE protein VTI1 n=1 Tax=Plasmodium gaboni TaxID=647221 RepID=A0A151LH27_9APIC|nr:putative vesicle transport v-SNARE protein VTI1 [Plasmodium gaboni]KYN98159.1 putative vesicle transport v-SNARE protein VTI1 [Plasmodium gaboni]SOV16568.1 vesicle transport v-SNARE protein VTI1, putative [Plasmodium gaboni]SOV23902.1 vesicle transport v-SNARE protein VTI1, putative [Plasmodium sp. DRC-Itaito]